MRSLFRFHRAAQPLALALVVALTPPLAAFADDGTARVSVVDGTLSIGHGNSHTPVDAVTNAPVVAGDYVTTGAQSRGELAFDGTTAVRLGENVQLRVAHLEASSRQLQLAAGTIEYRLLRGTDGTNTIDTPSISIVPKMAGTYRISVDADGTTEVTVRSGDADTVTPQGTQSLEPGTTLIARGAAANPHITTRDAIAYDDFDAFNQDRDRAQLAALQHSNTVTSVTAAPIEPPSYAAIGWAPSYAYVAPVVRAPSYAYAVSVVRAPSYVALPPTRVYAAWGGAYRVGVYGAYGVYRSGAAAARAAGLRRRAYDVYGGRAVRR